MAYTNRFNLSDEHRRNELIRIVEHSVESALAESRTSYCTIKGTDEDCLSRQSFLYILEHPARNEGRAMHRNMK